MSRPLVWPRGYYVYLFCYPDATPYYVGIGKGNRANRVNRNQWANRIDAKIRANGENTRLFLLEVPDREVAALLERQLIRDLGRRHLDGGLLVNITDGGDGGSSGRVLSKDALRRIAEGQLGRKQTLAQRQAASERSKGNKHALGYKHDEATLAKISQASRGRKLNISPEDRERRAAHARRLNLTQSPPRRGVPCSEEHKRKISEARKRNARN